jgi:hypothetical protein
MDSKWKGVVIDKAFSASGTFATTCINIDNQVCLFTIISSMEPYGGAWTRFPLVRGCVGQSKRNRKFPHNQRAHYNPRTDYNKTFFILLREILIHISNYVLLCLLTQIGNSPSYHESIYSQYSYYLRLIGFSLAH